MSGGGVSNIIRPILNPADAILDATVGTSPSKEVAKAATAVDPKLGAMAGITQPGVVKDVITEKETNKQNAALVAQMKEDVNKLPSGFVETSKSGLSAGSAPSVDSSLDSTRAGLASRRRQSLFNTSINRSLLGG